MCIRDRPLTDDGGQGGTRHSHPKDRHQQDIQHHIQTHRGQDTVEGNAGVTHPPQDGGQGVVTEDEQQPHTADPQIGHRLCQGGGIEQHQERTTQHQQHNRQYNAGRKTHGEHIARSLFPLLLFSRPVVLAHQDIACLLYTSPHHPGRPRCCPPGRRAAPHCRPDCPCSCR